MSWGDASRGGCWMTMCRLRRIPRCVRSDRGNQLARPATQRDDVLWQGARGRHSGLLSISRETTGTAYLATRAKPVARCADSVAERRRRAGTSAPERTHRQVGMAQRLDRHLAAFAGSARELSLYGSTLLRAVDWAVHPITRIEVAGPA